MRIRESNDRVTITDLPVGDWIWGSVFAFGFGVFLLFLLVSAWQTPHHFIGSAGQSLFDRAMTILMFGMLLAFVAGMTAFFLSMAFRPAIRTTIDHKTGTVFIARRGVINGRSERYLFSQIRGFGKVVVTGDTTSEYVALILANGQAVRIESKPAPDRPELIDHLNTFIRRA